MEHIYVAILINLQNCFKNFQRYVCNVQQNRKYDPDEQTEYDQRPRSH